MAIARTVGIPAKPELGIGAWLTGAADLGGWIAGIPAFVLLYGAVALLYAFGFERVRRGTTAGLGMLFTLMHIAVVFVLLALLPLGAPGWALQEMGWSGTLTFLLLHFAYGALVTGIYGGGLQVRARPWWASEREASV